MPWQSNTQGEFLIVLKYYRILPYCIVPHRTERTIPYNIVPCCTTPYHTEPYCIITYCTIPYHTILYHTILYCTLTTPYWLYRITPYHTEPYHSILYRTVPHRIVLYRIKLYHTELYRTVSNRTEPYRTEPNWTISYRTEPYRTVPYVRQIRLNSSEHYILCMYTWCSGLSSTSLRHVSVRRPPCSPAYIHTPPTPTHASPQHPAVTTSKHWYY